MINIVDNFLNHEDWKNIHDHMISPLSFNWYYNKSSYDHRFGPSDNAHWSYSQLTHLFYSNVVQIDCHPIGLISRENSLIQPILNLISPCILIRAKANLTTPATSMDDPSKTFHTDTGVKDSITAIYYVNDNDGKTIFKDGSKVDSVANRMLIFPNHIEHGVERATKLDRFVINFNYIKGY